MIKHGPVDVVVLAAGEPRFDGSVLAALGKRVASGTIRVLDAMVLVKDETGQRLGANIEDVPEDIQTTLGFVDTGTRGLFDTEDAETLYEGMVPGSAILALAIEHAWAVDLVNALAKNGVEVALNFRVPALVVNEAFASLEKKA